MPSNIAARAGRWSATHRRPAVVGWLVFVIAATLLGGAVGTRTLEPADEGNGQSQIADRAIAGAGFPDEADEQVLLQGRGSTEVGDPAFAAATRDVVARLRQVAHVRDIESPLAAGNRGQISRDGRSALVTFKLAGDDDAAADRVDAALAATAAAQRIHPGVRIEQFGGASAGNALGDVLADDFAKAERVSLPITLLILLVAFGALVAAGLPLLLGLTAVLGTIGLLAPVSRLAAATEQVNVVVLLIGLAVGVDYSMFYLRREIEERRGGRSPAAAVAAAAATSGRAVLTSGLTVMIAMSGMFLAGNATYVSFAIGTILVVAVAVIGSLTFLPATLAWLGEKGWTEKGRLPWIGRRSLRPAGGSRLWGPIVDRVLRRPLASAVAATALLVAPSVPALGLKTITPGVSAVPRDIAVMQTYDRIQAAFPGGPLPASVVVRAADVGAPAVRRGIAKLRSRALATGVMSEPVTVTTNPARTLALVAIPLQGTGTDAASNAALASLRDDVIPATIGAVAGTTTHVSGTTARSRDQNESLAAHLPLVFAFVLTLAFVLLLVTFRSIVIPIKAIVLNLLSVGASYGVLKLVFQDGHGERLLGFQSLGGVVGWLPLFLFVILFGLSMDYHVFILSRIREAFDGGMSTDDAIAHGIKSTAGVVTSAALVMVAVFSVFASLSIMDFKQMGVGLGVAILIDATIVRGVLLPATMKLLGDWNWYLPSGLRRLGTPAVEPAPEPARG